MSTLDIRYRRLMFAYPRDYRSHRGAEIAGTLAEMAPTGRRWPRGRDAVSLFFHGLRARLGRPRSRVILPLALLVALIGGFCAAGAGAWVGWHGSTTVPATRAAVYAEQILPLRNVNHFLDSEVEGSAWTTMPRLYYIDRFDLVPSITVQSWMGTTPDATTYIAQQRARLAGTGWVVTHISTHANGESEIRTNGVITGVSSTHHAVAMTIRHGDVGAIITGVPGRDGQISAAIYRTTPWYVPVLAVVAGLLGAVATYLFIGWLSRRSARLPRFQQIAVLVGTGLTGLFLLPTAIVSAVCAWGVAVVGVPVPVAYWAGFTAEDLRPAAIAAAVMLVVTMSWVALMRPVTSQESAA